MTKMPESVWDVHRLQQLASLIECPKRLVRLHGTPTLASWEVLATHAPKEEVLKLGLLSLRCTAGSQSIRLSFPKLGRYRWF